MGVAHTVMIVLFLLCLVLFSLRLVGVTVPSCLCVSPSCLLWGPRFRSEKRMSKQEATQGFTWPTSRIREGTWGGWMWMIATWSLRFCIKPWGCRAVMCFSFMLRKVACGYCINTHDAHHTPQCIMEASALSYSS